MRATTDRQKMAAVWAALLAPASALVATLARWGGGLGWLGPLAALPFALFGVWRYHRLGPGGICQALKTRWGGVGKALLPIYYLWAALTAALTAGSCVDRLRRTDYGETSAWVLALALTAVAAYLVCRGARVFSRAVEVLYLALAAVAGLFLALGAFHVHWESLRPEAGRAAGAVGAALPVLCTFAVGGLAAFLPREGGENGPKEAEKRTVWPRWVAGWCLVTAALGAVVMGTLGPAVTAQGPQPLFLALQGLGGEGGFQRLEALGTAAWVLSDLILIGLAALAGQGLAGERPWGAWPVAACAFLGGCFLDNETVAPFGVWLQGINLALGGVLPVLLSLGQRRGRPYLVGNAGSPPQNIEE